MKYDLIEARALIQQKADAYQPDEKGRREAMRLLVADLLTLSVEMIRIKMVASEPGFDADEEKDPYGFTVATRGASITVFVTGDEILIQDPTAKRAHQPISDLDYDPIEKIFVGPVIQNDLEKKRRSAAAVVVEQLLAALDHKKRQAQL